MWKNPDPRTASISEVAGLLSRKTKLRPGSGSNIKTTTHKIQLAFFAYFLSSLFSSSDKKQIRIFFLYLDSHYFSRV